MNNPFTVEETNLICIFHSDSRAKVIEGNPKDYVLHDKLSGLKFDPNSLKVKVGTRELTANTDYTLVANPTDGDSFDVEFINGKLKTNDVVVVTYSATVAADATIAGAGNTNKAKLDYSGKHSTDEKTTTYVWKLNVHKYTRNSTNEEVALSGAKFVLYRMDGDTKEYAKLTNGKIDGWVANQSDATTLETSSTGDVLIQGLNVGTYYLEETEAPVGYNKLAKPIEVKITATTDDATGVSETVEYRNENDSTYTPATNATVKVLNEAGTQLPSTGGIGTTIFYVIGGGLMAVAAVLLVTKKRMNSK